MASSRFESWAPITVVEPLKAKQSSKRLWSTLLKSGLSSNQSNNQTIRRTDVFASVREDVFRKWPKGAGKDGWHPLTGAVGHLRRVKAQTVTIVMMRPQRLSRSIFCLKDVMFFATLGTRISRFQSNSFCNFAWNTWIEPGKNLENGSPKAADTLSVTQTNVHKPSR